MNDEQDQKSNNSNWHPYGTAARPISGQLKVGLTAFSFGVVNVLGLAPNCVDANKTPEAKACRLWLYAMPKDEHIENWSVYWGTSTASLVR